MITKQQIELAEERVRVETALTDFIQHCWDFWQEGLPNTTPFIPHSFVVEQLGEIMGGCFELPAAAWNELALLKKKGNGK